MRLRDPLVVYNSPPLDLDLGFGGPGIVGSTGDFWPILTKTLASGDSVSFYHRAPVSDLALTFSFYCPSGSAAGANKYDLNVYEVDIHGKRIGSAIATYSAQTPSATANEWTALSLTSPTTGTQPYEIKGRFYEYEIAYNAGSLSVGHYRGPYFRGIGKLIYRTNTAKIRDLTSSPMFAIEFTTGNKVLGWFQAQTDTTVNIVDSGTNQRRRGIYLKCDEPLVIRGFQSMGGVNGTPTAASVPKVYHYTSPNGTTWTLDSNFPSCKFRPIYGAPSRRGMAAFLLGMKKYHLSETLYHGFVVGTTTPPYTDAANCVAMHENCSSANLLPLRGLSKWTPGKLLARLQIGPLGTNAAEAGSPTWVTDGSLPSPMLWPLLARVQYPVEVD